MRSRDRNAETKHIKVHALLLSEMEALEWKAGHPLPAESTLMQRFRVSRNTVRHALASLEHEGLIYRRQGKGSFCSGRRPGDRERSLLAGVVMPQHYIFPEVIRGIDEVARAHRYHVVLSNNRWGQTSDEVILQEIVGKNIDGLLYLPVGTPRPAEILSWLRPLDIPLVVMSWDLKDPNISFVALDDAQGGRLAAEHLLDAGHVRIAYIGMRDHLPSIERGRGCEAALTARGIERDPSLVRWIRSADPAVFRRSAYDETAALLERRRTRPSAIFYMSDDAAVAGCRAIRDAGLSVPGDISVVGFDDSELAANSDPPLTSVLYPKYHLGRWSAEILFEQIEGTDTHTARQIIIQPKLTVRESVSRRARSPSGK